MLFGARVTEEVGDLSLFSSLALTFCCREITTESLELRIEFFFHIVFLYYIILVGFRLVTFMYYDGVGDWDLAWGVAFCMVWGSPSFGTM